jgi:cytochrome c
MSTKTAGIPGIVAAGVAAVAFAGIAQAQTAPDPKRGAEVFRVQCSVCHTVESGKHSIGPSLHGVVGRPAGSASGFKYSDWMKKVTVAWTPENLDRYLENPMSVAPGTPMALVVPSKRNRDDVIAFLKTVSPAKE